MSSIQAVSLSRHIGKRWKRYVNYSFAAQEAVVGLVAQELPKAMMSLPIAFIPVDSGFMPAGVLGLTPGKNLFVTPDGRWIPGHYVPALLRSYPFRIARAESDGFVLCIDEASGLMTDDPVGEPFFDEEGKPAKAMQEVLVFLEHLKAGQESTLKACEVLQRHGLIQPWPITLQVESADNRSVQGLYRIDEAVLGQLNAEALYELKQSGALTIAYCQLLSMQHFSQLGQLMQAHAQLAAAAQPSKELDLEFLNQSDTISF